MKIQEFNISDIISFIYKGGRKVIGEIVGISYKHKGVLLKLHTDYIGKNEEWYIGEEKYFNISEIKSLKQLKKD